MSDMDQQVPEPGYCHPDYQRQADLVRGLMRRNGADPVLRVALSDGVHDMRINWVAGPHPSTGRPANWPIAVDEQGRAIAGDPFEVPPLPSSLEWRP